MKDYNHEKDYDSAHDREDALTKGELKERLTSSLQDEHELLKEYTVMAERVHDDQKLKERLQNFAEGNAKRARQLEDELDRL